MVNTVFEAYYGKEEEFEKTFGFPMYTISSDGNIDYNYEYLILDFFCWTFKDEYNIKAYCESFYAPEEVEPMCNTIAGYTIEDVYGNIAEYYGLVEDENVEFEGAAEGSYFWTYESFEKYLKENYGVGSKVTYAKDENVLSEEKYDDVMEFNRNSEIIEYYNENKTENNYITIAAFGYYLYSMDGKFCFCGNASEGHAMEIVDITEEGDIIVSSWGQEFKLDIDPIFYSKYEDDEGTEYYAIDDWCYLVINEY